MNRCQLNVLLGNALLLKGAAGNEVIGKVLQGN